ncbi:Hypothetical protein CINCED_3A012984 [Cinara cedri]|uniref:BZIP domain-containing protein n=1 Tax=Cinara cedri TaxID=506608 RepID=A0A5E4MUQ0_9HEMI|nr:Hypothetical protein CINCED_3A012984 [Cinara cedri]
MFSNRQQQDSSKMLHQITSTGSIVGLPPPPPAISLSSITTNCNISSSVTSVAILALDSLNCGGIPTRTTPTLTPTTLRSIAADLSSLAPGQPENFAASAASDLHHLVSSSCKSVNVTTSGSADRINSDLQDRHNLQILSGPHTTISLESLHNHQPLGMDNLQNEQHSLNQQQRNDYNNSFSAASSRQAGFVPPLVLQINSANSNTQPPSGTTVLLTTNNSSGSSSVFSAKGSSNSASSSHWQGAVVTQRPQHRARSVTKKRFTDDEDFDENYDSADTTDSSDASGKMGRKQNNKNGKSTSKNSIKSEFKTTSNPMGSGRRTNNKDGKIMSAEEEQRRQIRRERNKLAAARCRKRRMDHTNELLEETEQLEDKRLRLQVEIQGLRQQKTDLQQMLAHHKCISNSISTATTTVISSNEISESDLSNTMSAVKQNPLQQQNISTSINSGDVCGDILIKCEDSIVLSDEDSKSNIDIIPTSVLQHSHRRRPTTLLQLNSNNFGNGKKISGTSSNGVVVLNFDSLMDGGTGLTPISSTGGNVPSHQIQRNTVENSSEISINNIKKELPQANYNSQLS